MNTYKPTTEQRGIPHAAFRPPHSFGFTLIEMIVVTGIIAVLAALIFPVTGAVKKARDLSRARTELMLVAHAIDGYKDKLGHYPPDNAVPLTQDAQRYMHSQLFYELRGTVQTNNGNFVTLDGSVTITPSDIQSAFGTSGFVNCTRGGGDEAQPAQRFLPGLQAGQYVDAPVNGVNCRLLGCSFDGPNTVLADPTSARKFSPWWYNSSAPTNNPNSYDLWVDIQVGSKIYRVSNWSTTPRTMN